MFLGFAVWHPLALERGAGQVMGVVAGATAVLLAAAATLAQRGRVRPGRAHAVAAGLISAGFGNIVLQYVLTGDRSLTVNVVLVMITTGLCLLDPRWTAGLVGGLGLTWLVVAGSVDGGESAGAALPTVVVGAAVAALGNVVRLSMLHRLLETQAELQLLSQRDDLTGLLNRRGFLEAAQRALDARRPVRLWFVDVDDLKSVNDSRGHDVGDVLLVSVAAALSDVFSGGIVARLSGDEFAVVEDHGSGADDGRARAALEERLALASRVTGLRVAVSTGSVLAEPGSGLSELLSAADAAMYASKNERRTIRLPATQLGVPGPQVVVVRPVPAGGVALFD
jgi:diguanylate cyclase (GGDEF)-like protein